MQLSMSHIRARRPEFGSSDDRFPLEVGLVRLLHPAILEENGAVALVPDDLRVIGAHPFAIALVIAGAALLFPLFSRPGGGKVEIPVRFRSGHPHWTRRPCFMQRRQEWLAPEDAIDAAARAAGDQSRPSSPNRIDPVWFRKTL